MIKAVSLILIVLSLSKVISPFLSTVLFLFIGLIFFYAYAQNVAPAIKLFWPFYIIIVPLFFSSFWAEYDALKSLTGVLQLTISILILATIVYSIHVEKLVLSIGVGTSIIIIAGLIFGNEEFYYPTKEIINLGLFQGKNNASLFASYCSIFSLCLSFIYRKKIVISILFLGTFAASFLFMAQANSLGSMVAVTASIIFALFVYMINFKNKNHIKFLKITAPCITFTFISILFIIISIMDIGLIDYQNFMVEIGKDPTITGRTLIWENALVSIVDKPLLGIGYRNFWLTENPLADIAFRNPTFVGGYHNSFLMMIVETGLIGFIFVIPFWLKLLAGFYQNILTESRSVVKFLSITLCTFFLIKCLFEDIQFRQFDLQLIYYLVVWKIFYQKINTIKRF